MALIRDYVTLSQKVFHAYVDSSRPDDSGDGLTLATAKKTIAAGISVLPDTAVDHVVLHLKGALSISDYTLINLGSYGNLKRFLIDGGDDVEVVIGPYTATSTTTTSITDTARSWAVNAYQGYAVEILDGAAAGYICTIQSNTSDTLTVGIAWPDPGATPQYRIVRPATTIAKTASGHWFYFVGKANYRVTIQRLRFIGDIYIGTYAPSSIMNFLELADVIQDGSGNARGFACYNHSGTIFWYTIRDPANPGSSLDTSIKKRGVAFRGTTIYAAVSVTGSLLVYGPATISGTIAATNPVSSINFYAGAWAKKIDLAGAKLNLGSSVGNGLISGSADVGISAKDSRIVVTGGDTAISNNASHGITLDNSVLEFVNAKLTGSGNGGAGVYAFNNSAILAKDGQESTLTGTVGDISVDGATELMTWADVEAGTKADIIGDVSVKKVA
jgi:hypothetical protein